MKHVGSFLRALLLACALGAPAQGALVDTLKDHLDQFIAANYPGAMSYSVTEQETIGLSSDLDALADLMTQNWYVIDRGASDFVKITGSEAGRQRQNDQTLKPQMAIGALVARIDWTWGSKSATEYALVTPAAVAGDVSTILEGVVGWYRKLAPALAASSVEYNYNNGFGMHVAHFEASIKCEGGICIPHVHAWASLPGDNVDWKSKVWCANNMCIMDVAFVGYTGWPDVEFEAKDYKFKVSGWGWQWHTSYDRLTISCPCTPSPEPVAMNTIGEALALVDDTRIQLTDKAVTRSLPHMQVGWIEETDRSAAIRLNSAQPLHQGRVVDLTGTLNTVGATREVVCDTLITDSGFAHIAPLYMVQRTMGGQSRNPHTPGVTDGVGLNNVGLLARTWGVVTGVGEGFFYMDDGSALWDGTGHRGLRVFAENAPPVFPGQFVQVTGVVNAAILLPGATRIRMLIPASPNDIQPGLLGLTEAAPPPAAGRQALDFISP